MSKKRMLADVLWQAANEHLWHGREGQVPIGQTSVAASCIAVADAMRGAPDSQKIADRFLIDLGCDTTQFLFKEFLYGEPRQGARYMWLLLAMHVAEDEGITV